MKIRMYNIVYKVYLSSYLDFASCPNSLLYKAKEEHFFRDPGSSLEFHIVFSCLISQTLLIGNSFWIFLFHNLDIFEPCEEII